MFLFTKILLNSRSVDTHLSHLDHSLQIIQSSHWIEVCDLLSLSVMLALPKFIILSLQDLRHLRLILGHLRLLRLLLFLGHDRVIMDILGLI
jgi:hypothetical protein